MNHSFIIGNFVFLLFWSWLMWRCLFQQKVHHKQRGANRKLNVPRASDRSKSIRKALREVTKNFTWAYYGTTGKSSPPPQTDVLTKIFRPSRRPLRGNFWNFSQRGFFPFKLLRPSLRKMCPLTGQTFWSKFLV